MGDGERGLSSLAVNAAKLLIDQARFSEAEALLQQAVEVRRRVLGNDDPGTLAAVSALAVVLGKLRKFRDAVRLSEEALEGYRRVRGPEHAETLLCMYRAGALQFSMGRSSQATPLLREALAGLRATPGREEHPEASHVMRSLAMVRREMGQDAEAEALLSEALTASERVYGPEHPDTLACINSLAIVLTRRVEARPEAEALLRRALAVRRRLVSDEHPDSIVAMNNLGRLLDDTGRRGVAEGVFLDALAVSRRVLGEGHPITQTTLSFLEGVRHAISWHGRGEDLGPGDAILPLEPTPVPPPPPVAPPAPPRVLVENPVAVRPGPVHAGIACDGCGEAPLSGPRFKCAGCTFYDLCEACYSRSSPAPVHPSSHAFFRIEVEGGPGFLVPPAGGVAIAHFGVQCDGCGESPIRGPRFKCRACGGGRRRVTLLCLTLSRTSSSSCALLHSVICRTSTFAAPATCATERAARPYRALCTRCPTRWAGSRCLARLLNLSHLSSIKARRALVSPRPRDSESDSTCTVTSELEGQWPGV